MYKRILYAADITHLSSVTGVKRAEALAEALGAELDLCYVSTLNEERIEDEVYFGKQDGDKIAEDGLDAEAAALATVLASSKLTDERVHLLQGPIDMAVSALAKSLGVDLICVMKAHRRFHFLHDLSEQLQSRNKIDILSFDPET